MSEGPPQVTSLEPPWRLVKKQPPTPAAFLLPLAEAPGPNGEAGGGDSVLGWGIGFWRKTISRIQTRFYEPGWENVKVCHRPLISARM